jgi:uncharacterized membrane protein
MNTLLTMIVLTTIFDLAWVLGSGIYNGFIVGSMSTAMITILWSVVILSQSLLLYLLTRNTHGWQNRAILGALQGFTVYSVFNITAKVVFPSTLWPTNIAVIDTIWGTVLFALVAALSSSTIAFNPSQVHPSSIFNLL